MFAGKTTEMCRRVRREWHARRRTVVFKYAKDTRFGADAQTLRTHDGDEMSPAVAVSSTDEILAYVRAHRDLEVLGVDEGQFLPGLAQLAEACALQLRLDVIVAALDTKFDRSPFEETARLALSADKVLKLKAVCFVCQDKYGIFSHRTVPSDAPELIGGAEAYMALCRACYAAKNPERVPTFMI
jgi:thymidine kinase